MSEQQIGQLMFTQALRMGDQIDFGLELGAVMTGQAQIPPLGLRVDVAYEGEVSGPGLSGTIRGVDYVHMQGDGNANLHIHAVITTDDGARIAVAAEGIGCPREGTPIVSLREMVSMHTAAPAYAWVNTKRFFAVGDSNLQTGEITLSCYAQAAEMATT